MTVTPTIIKGGIKSNSVPESVRLTCDVRTLPHQDDKYVAQELAKILEHVPGVDFQIDYMAIPNASSFETPLARSIKSSTARILGTGQYRLGTCHKQRVYRFPVYPCPGRDNLRVFWGPSDDDPMLTRAHGTDESIGIKSLISGTKAMLALAIDLLDGKAGRSYWLVPLISS